MNIKKIAIVYDWMDSWGGVERVLLTLHEMFPAADFYTSYYNPKKATWAKDLNIRTSFIQKLPDFIKTSRMLSLPLYPYAFESFDFRDYKLVISVSSSFAKGIITRPDTLHVSYLLTPTRFLWSHTDQYIKKDWKQPISSVYLEKLREWDTIAAYRPDHIISLSKAVAARCKKYYRRDSDVIYPPFDIDYWKKIKQGFQSYNPDHNNSLPKKYFLVVSRLEPYKKVDQAIKVFNKKSDEALVIVGSGSQEKSLKQKAGKNIHFRKGLSDSELGDVYTHAEALIMPQEEDFGYVALEAQSFGCPVIAYSAGGALETVIEGVSGVFYPFQTAESLQTGLEKHHTMSYNISSPIGNLVYSPIEKFSTREFKKKLLLKINNLITV